MAPFIIYALPRSRTFWLSRFLSYATWECGHDEIRHMRSMADVDSWFAQPNVGTVETAASPWWRLAPDGVRTVVVRRPVAEVVDSLMRTGVRFDQGKLEIAMRRADMKLDQIERRVPGVLSVQFADLSKEDVAAAVFERCLPYQHDAGWWRHMQPLNLQVNLHSIVKYCQAHAPQLAKMSTIAKHKAIAAMSRRAIVEHDGLIIQQESFATFLRDAPHLLSEHLEIVGEAPDNYLNKNLALMQKLDNDGCMQVTTARCNGRMFGYLMAVTAPSLESPNVTSAMNLTFYASKEFPGLGLKLQRASLAGLRARGVGEVFMRAGPRGSGPKMGSLYRRLGAETAGQLFTLELE